MPINHELDGYYVIDTKGVTVSAEVREDLEVAFKKAREVKAADIKTPKVLMAFASYADDDDLKVVSPPVI